MSDRLTSIAGRMICRNLQVRCQSLLLVAIAGFVSVQSSEAGLGLRPAPQSSITDQGTPPVAAPLVPYLPRFVRHYTTYSTLPPDEKPTFSQWLIVNGVIDPTAHRAMMMLYAWAERIG